jgi:hypothetical protein
MTNKVNLNEGASLQGRVTITQYEGIRDKSMLLDLHQGRAKAPPGIVRVSKKNLIVSVGRKNMAHLLGNDPLAGPITYMAFGGSNLDDASLAQDAAADQFALDSELFREPVIYTFDDGTPNYSVTFTAAALATEHADANHIFELGLVTSSADPTASAGDMDLFSRVAFPPVFFDANAPVSMGLVVDWEILFQVI